MRRFIKHVYFIYITNICALPSFNYDTTMSIPYFLKMREMNNVINLFYVRVVE